VNPLSAKEELEQAKSKAMLRKALFAKLIPDHWAIVATTPNVFVACPMCEMVHPFKTDYAVRP
jgi:ribulose-5-phosphate 4-epimerase/fuculose-1-phosphate aldolase